MKKLLIILMAAGSLNCLGQIKLVKPTYLTLIDSTSAMVQIMDDGTITLLDSTSEIIYGIEEGRVFIKDNDYKKAFNLLLSLNVMLAHYEMKKANQ